MDYKSKFPVYGKANKKENQSTIDVAKRVETQAKQGAGGFYNIGNNPQSQFNKSPWQSGYIIPSVEYPDTVNTQQILNKADRVQSENSESVSKTAVSIPKTGYNYSTKERTDAIIAQNVPNMTDRIKAEKNKVVNKRTDCVEEEDEEEENRFYGRKLRRKLSLCDNFVDYYNLSQHIWDPNFKPITVNEPVSVENNINKVAESEVKRPINSIYGDKNKSYSTYADSIKGEQIDVDSVISLDNKQLATNDTVKPRNIAYKVNPKTCTLEEDTTVVDEPKTITIGGRIGSERTVKQLTGEDPYMSKIAELGVNKIRDDYNNKYSKNGFPSNYYTTIGEFLVNCAFEESEDYGIALGTVASLIDSRGDFDNGKGTPLYHVYESVVRNNDDTGLDKLLHFMYSAKIAYDESRYMAYIKGFAKEFVKDELRSYVYTDEIGWDDKDMKANADGIKYGLKLYRGNGESDYMRLLDYYDDKSNRIKGLLEEKIPMLNELNETIKMLKEKGKD